MTWSFFFGFMFAWLLVGIAITILWTLGDREIKRGRRARRDPIKTIAVLICPTCDQRNRVLWVRIAREKAKPVCGNCHAQLVYEGPNPALRQLDA